MADYEAQAAAEELEDADPVERAVSRRDPKSAKPWLQLLDESEKVFQTYQDKCDNIDKQYADLERLSNVARDRQMQLFWANVQVIAPSIYSRPPVPVVVPRFKDKKPVPRCAAELLERTSIVTFELEDVHNEMKLVRDDLAINGRGVAWLRYEASGKGDGFKECVRIEHKDRKDFRHGVARKWGEVPWVASAAWMTRGEMRKRFFKTSGNLYKDATYSVRKDDKDGDDQRRKACVWELWHKFQNKVVWVAEGCDEVLDQGEPHLKLEGFFPCPRPAYATLQRRTLIPVPDFLFYKDQIEEINELTGRIGALADALKVRGFYPAGAGDIADAIEAAVKNVVDNQVLIGVANWAAIGGVAPKDLIVWLPLEQVATTIKELVALRKQLMEDVYEITGLSDIMRGQTEASETARAQELKSQYGSVRIRDRQDEMVRLARDITRIAGEIMSENFQPATLLAMSQYDIATEAQLAEQIKPLQGQLVQLQGELASAQRDPETMQLARANPQQAQQIMGQFQQQAAQLQGQIGKIQQQPTIEKVMQLLRSQRLRPYVLDIETDSTIAPDENAQKQRATEFVTAVGGFMEKALPAISMNPQAAPVAAELLKYVASQFRAGRELEGVIDEFADKMAQAANQPKPPDPEAVKQQAAAEEKAAKVKQDAERAQVENAERAANAQKTAAEASAKQVEAQTKAEDAAAARKIKLQDADEAAADRRIEREGKVRVTNKQIELLEAKRLEEAQAHAQAMDKGVLEINLLNARIEQAKKPPAAPASPKG